MISIDIEVLQTIYKTTPLWLPMEMHKPNTYVYAYAYAYTRFLCKGGWCVYASAYTYAYARFETPPSNTYMRTRTRVLRKTSILCHRKKWHKFLLVSYFSIFMMIKLQSLQIHLQHKQNFVVKGRCPSKTGQNG